MDKSKYCEAIKKVYQKLFKLDLTILILGTSGFFVSIFEVILFIKYIYQQKNELYYDKIKYTYNYKGKT